jgi:hypothetical protein
MKGQVLSSHHSMEIEGFQIDIYFDFQSSKMIVYIEGKQFTHSHYSPSFKTFNYVNLMDIAAHTLSFYKMKQQREIKQLKEQAGMTEADEWEGW